MNHLRSRVRRDDSGATLIELIVAMGIFAILLGVFGSGMVVMTKNTARAQVVADATLEARKAFSLLDKQVRSASAVNRAVRVGDTWYVEFLTDATGASPAGVDNPSSCTQWRLNTGSNLLQTRSWNVGGSPTAWRTVATEVVNDAAATDEQPFTFHATNADYNRQRLEIDLRIQRGSAPVTQVESTLVARNTSLNTPTNLDKDSDGLTDRVCSDQGQP